MNRTYPVRVSITPARSAAARASCAALSNPVAAATRSGVGWEEAETIRRADRDIGGKPLDPHPEQLLQVAGDGQGGSRIPRVAFERPRDFEREERIAVRRFLDAVHERPWPRATEAGPEHRLERPDAQRPKRDALQPVGWQGPLEAKDDLPSAAGPVGEHEPDRLVSEAADGEHQSGSRRSVEPLEVVHDEHHASAAGTLAQEGEEGRGHGTSVERGVRLLPQQRDGQGAPLGPRKLRRLLVVGVFEEVPERGERQPATRVPRARNGAPRRIVPLPPRRPRPARCSSRYRRSPQ